MMFINTNRKQDKVSINTQLRGSRPEPAGRQTPSGRNLMTTLPLDLLVALSPFIALGILSLIGK